MTREISAIHIMAAYTDERLGSPKVNAAIEKGILRHLQAGIALTFALNGASARRCI